MESCAGFVVRGEWHEVKHRWGASHAKGMKLQAFMMDLVGSTVSLHAN